jgi:ATP-dependent helicase/nuclease subunit B
VAKRIRFYDWDKPVLRRAVEHLAGDRPGRLLDLSGTLILVPTRHAGRRLREALALDAARRSGAVLPGSVDTPSAVFRPAPNRRVADEFVEALVWADVLAREDGTRYPDLWPVAPEFGEPAAAFRFSRPFARLRRLLCEEDLTIPRLARTPPCAAEAGRWSDLARLEERYLARLRQTDWRDGCEERLAAAEAPPPPGIMRVILLFTPDPPPLALRTLARWAETIEVEVCVHAPESERGAFDEWGRPVPTAWAERTLDLQTSEIRRFAGPREVADGVADDVKALPRESRGSAVVGMPDPDLAPFLEAALERLGLAAYDPEGQPAGLRPPVATALGLLRAAEVRDVASLGELLRDPDVLERFAPDPARVLEEWDDLRAGHLPESREDVRRVLPGGDYPALAACLVGVLPLLEAMGKGGQAAGLLRALETVYRDRKLTAGVPGDDRFAEAARSVRDAVGEMQEIESSGLTTDRAACARALSVVLEQIRLHPDREPGSIDLLGWLELHWEDAPLLILTGLAEGCVPENVAEDPFLPGRAREALGMRGNAWRFARDLYLLTAMRRSRAPDACRVCLGATDGAGNPLKPSRLLFRCEPDRLSERVLHLFAEPDAPSPSPAWYRAWTLSPPPIGEVALPRHWGVTALREYLTCPFRFFLRQLLGMRSLDLAPREMDAQMFGTGCHAVLQSFGLEDGLKDSDDENRIAAFLCERVKEWMRDRFESNPGFAVRLQGEILANRMRAFARVQARERAEGWRIQHVEQSVSLSIEGMEIRGRIDRVDRNERTGELRALDYKTGEKPQSPKDVHLCKFRDGDPEWARVDLAGESWKWKDLQLPLYLRMLRASGMEVGSCGYFNLPAAASEAGSVAWPEFSPELESSAEACAARIVHRIRLGAFWPPVERVPYDDFETLFHRGIEASLDPEWVADAKRRVGEADR